MTLNRIVFSEETIGRLNSMTKYPSILTYHALANRGLKDELAFPYAFSNKKLEFYEKVDGENVRMVFIAQDGSVDFFIGSREEFLFSLGDRIANSYGNIAKHYAPIAERIASRLSEANMNNGLYVFYTESFGGNTRMAKHYTASKTQGVRLFDAIRMAEDQLSDMLQKPKEQIASWRDRGGQPFVGRDDREMLAAGFNLETVPLLAEFNGNDFPTSLEGVYGVLSQYPTTRVALDGDPGKNEGVIVRTSDRSQICKIRFEDYRKTEEIIHLISQK